MTKITNQEYMPLDSQRWDPSAPGFITTVLRSMIGLWIAVSLIGTLLYRAGTIGFITGGALAVTLYLVAIHAGRIFHRTRDYRRIMLWLLLTQFILWVGMALLLAVAKVNPIGFVVGVSILPTAILLALAWYTLRGRRLPS